MKARCPTSWSWKSRSAVTVIISTHLLFLPDLLFKTVIYYGISLSEDFRTIFCQKYTCTVYTELKQNQKWRQKGKCCMTDLRCIILIDNLNDVVLHTNYPDWVSLMYFSQKNTRFIFFFYTAKMASLSIDHWWSKFMGKNRKELTHWQCIASYDAIIHCTLGDVVHHMTWPFSIIVCEKLWVVVVQRMKNRKASHVYMQYMCILPLTKQQWWKTETWLFWS